MTESAVAYTDLPDSEEAGGSLGAQIAHTFKDEAPDVLLVFASSSYEYAALLRATQASCRPRILVGCSSAGELTSEAQGERSASALALRSSEMRFAAGVGRGLRASRSAAATELVSSFRGTRTQEYAYRSALILTDALAGHANELIDDLTLLTGGSYQFFGGGAGDDAQFRRTHVFYGTEAVPDAAVALEILSSKRLAVGVRHGWRPAGAGMRVTEADGMRVVSLNAVSTVEAFQEHAERTGQEFKPDDPLPFFLHNLLGVATGGEYKLRVPLTVHGDGSVECAADIPAGAIVHIMATSSASTMEAAAGAAEAAVSQLQGDQPAAALLFDCVATRLRMGGEYGSELAAIQQALGKTAFAGLNSYGQLARVDGQFSGFHNCTAVVCLIPK